MLISRKLDNKAQNRLQEILSLIQDGKTKEAVKAVHELGALLRRYVETVEEERARGAREESSR